MRKSFGPKPLLYPMPVLIIATYGEDGTPDAMNAAWGGLADTTRISICLSAGHKTTKNILKRKAFTVSMADAAHVTEADYLGIVSGNDVPDKLAHAHTHLQIEGPVVSEYPLLPLSPEVRRLVDHEGALFDVFLCPLDMSDSHSRSLYIM